MFNFLQRQGTFLVALNLVLFTCVLQCVTSREILLNPERRVGEDNETCLEEANTLPCKSLEYISERVTNDCSNLTIRMQSKEIQLGKVVMFQNCYSLSIVSEEPFIIRCPNKRKSAGFHFNNIAGLSLKNLILLNCQNKYRKTFSESSAATLQVFNSKDVTLENVHFYRSIPTAVMFNNTFGKVLLTNCSFKHNRLFASHKQIFSYPGGVYIEFTTNETETMYIITNCSFIANRAPDQFVKYAHSQLVPNGNWRGQGHGGGLDIIFTGLSNRIKVSILNCTFATNTAKWGGGMYTLFQGNASNNTVLVHNTQFDNNKAYSEGGGINIGFLQVSPSHNQIVFMNCSFLNNSADTGGGTSLFAVHAHVKPIAGKEILFQNCTWSKNMARSSAAVDIAPSHDDRLNQGFLFIPIFENCTFLNNNLYKWKETVDNPTYIWPNTTTTTTQYSGVFTVTKTTTVFDGSTIFIGNGFTALRATSSRLVFERRSKVKFHDNYGSKGAAIAMYGFSSLVFNSDSSFEFTNNSATSVGGAMYYETFDHSEFRIARKCFLQYKAHDLNQSVEARNVNFTFIGNTAETGTSIYSSSFYPCFFEWFDSFSGVKLSDFFDKIAFFNFDENNNSLATNGRRYELELTQNDRLATIPGKEMTVPLLFLDEFQQSRKTAYALDVLANSTINLHPEYTVDTTASFYGQPQQNFILLFNAQHVINTIAAMNVSLLPCPPGFYYNNKSCECAADNPARAFAGMTRCNTSAFYAYIQYGFWGGYDSLNKFYTALCPLSFCALTTNSSNPRHLHALPISKDELNKVMCGSNRKGILCGECQVNNSVYYHSSNYKCKQNRFCKLGFLFYILSEIFPTVILFSVIIAFNVSFTSGNINGFIFFCQVLSTITLNMRTLNEKILAITAFFGTFYEILNLDFFNIDKFSFCLWEGTTVMDILAFKYVTVLFALILVIGLIVLMNSRFCTKLNKKVKTNLSVIHGLSAFLVICYTQCTKISFYILTRVILQGEGGIDGQAVTFFGGIPYLKGKHLFYVIPAVICLVTITIIPPVLLLLYPLLYQLLSLCGLSEHRIVTKVSNAIAIHKMMPIFDSFQSCYKDKLRFFAGLYFVYRIAILATYSLCKNVIQFHVVTGSILFVIAGVHSAQPYKENSHNRIDSLLFLNLAVINALTLLYMVYAIESHENQGYLDRIAVLNATNTFQMIFIGLPLILIFCWFLFTTTRKIIKYLRKGSENVNSKTSEVDNLDDLLVSRDLGEESEYFKLTDKENITTST